MAIVIEQPIKIVLNEIEIDDRIPSVNFDLQIEITHLTYSMNYKGNIWIACSELDCFIQAFRQGETAFSLEDTFGNRFLSFRKIEGGYQFCLEKSRKTISNSTFSVCHSECISQDVFHAIRNQFVDYLVLR